MTVEDNWTDVVMRLEPTTVKIDGMVSPLRAEWYIFRQYWELHSPMYERTLYNSYFAITICFDDSSECVTIITTIRIHN
jgi:hypothetical protein